MDIDPSSSLLATGSADATIRVWDMQHLFCTHNFRGHRGIITSLRFHSKMGEMLLFSGDEEGLIKVWDLNKKRYLLY